jgi:hypothetical protein
VLRNQLSIQTGEDSISPQDERLLLVQHWLESIPGAHNVFEIWDGVAQVGVFSASLFWHLVLRIFSLATKRHIGTLDIYSLVTAHATFVALHIPCTRSTDHQDSTYADIYEALELVHWRVTQ